MKFLSSPVAVIIVSSVIFVKVTDAACVAAYGQCGGIGYSGPTCCVTAYQCVFGNAYYSQCVPSTTKDPRCTGNMIWAQCGGAQYTGTTCCPAGSRCVRKDEWYSQCLPESQITATVAKTVRTTTLKSVTVAATSTSKKLTTTTLKTAATTTTSKKTVATSSLKATATSAATKASSSSAVVTSSASSATPLHSGVLATEHMANEVGSCSLPEATYAVHFPVALGDIASLQKYRWRPEMCGHILRINCNTTNSVDIIVSNSNIGGGMDLYASTWNLATGSKPPGVTYCTVQLTNRNPITSSTPGYLCYYNEGWQDYYHNIALLNTNERIVVGATFGDGRVGAHRGGNPYFAFDGYAKPEDTTVTFRFEDGGTYKMKLSDCISGVAKHQWS